MKRSIAKAPSVSSLFFVCLATLMVGCSSLLAAKPDPTRYWVLGSANATAAAAAGSETITSSDVHIGIGPVTLPEYLKDRHVLVRSGANQLEGLPADYWAEPLDAGFPRALLYDVSQAMHTGSAVLYPWYSSKRVRWAVPIDVLQFETSASGEGLLVARWRVIDEPDGTVAFASESHIVEPASGPAGESTEQRVAVLRRSVTRLAGEIAARIEEFSNSGAASAKKVTPAVRPHSTPPAAQTSGETR